MSKWRNCTFHPRTHTVFCPRAPPWHTVGGRDGLTNHVADRIGTFESRAYTSDAGIHKDFGTYVVLSGNTTMLQGLSVRMQNELTASAPETTQITVVA